MANDENNSQPSGAWPQLRSGPLIAGGVLIAAGAVAGLIGLAVAGSHIVAQTRAWVKELEVPPGQLARMKWQQARSAAASGASTWREHPHSQVRLVRRAAADSD